MLVPITFSFGTTARNFRAGCEINMRLYAPITREAASHDDHALVLFALRCDRGRSSAASCTNHSFPVSLQFALPVVPLRLLYTHINIYVMLIQSWPL